MRTAEGKRLAKKERCILIDVDEEIAVNAAKIKHNLKWEMGDCVILRISILNVTNFIIMCEYS